MMTISHSAKILIHKREIIKLNKIVSNGLISSLIVQIQINTLRKKAQLYLIINSI